MISSSPGDSTVTAALAPPHDAARELAALAREHATGALGLREYRTRRARVLDALEAPAEPTRAMPAVPPPAADAARPSARPSACVERPRGRAWGVGGALALLGAVLACLWWLAG